MIKYMYLQIQNMFTVENYQYIFCSDPFDGRIKELLRREAHRTPLRDGHKSSKYEPNTFHQKMYSFKHKT